MLVSMSRKRAWRPLNCFAWMGSVYFGECFCGTSGKSYYFCILGVSHLNNPSPSAAYVNQWIRSALVRVMACRLFAPGLCLGQCWVIVNWNRFQFVSCFNHLPLVPHICVSELGQHWFGWWLVAYSAPGLCLGQCWVTVNWNRLQFVFFLIISSWCRVYASVNQVSIGSDDGLSPIRARPLSGLVLGYCQLEQVSVCILF